MQLCPVLSVQQCQAGPSPRQKIEPMYSILYPYVVHVQSKKSDYDNGTRVPSPSVIETSRVLKWQEYYQEALSPCLVMLLACWNKNCTTKPTRCDLCMPFEWSILFYQPCAGRCFQHPFLWDDQDVTTRSFYPTMFFDGLWMRFYMNDEGDFPSNFSFLFFAFIFDFILSFFFISSQLFNFVQLQPWIASGDLKVYHRQPIFYWVDKG